MKTSTNHQLYPAQLKASRTHRSQAFITNENQLAESYQAVANEIRRKIVRLQLQLNRATQSLELVQKQFCAKRPSLHEDIFVSPIRIAEADHPTNLHIDIMATPQMAIEKARRLSQIEVAPTAKRKRKSRLRVSGTFSVEESDALLTTEENEAAAKELDSRRKRLQRYLKWPSFRLFCRDREIDIDGASEEVLLAWRLGPGVTEGALSHLREMEPSGEGSAHHGIAYIRRTGDGHLASQAIGFENPDMEV